MIVTLISPYPDITSFGIRGISSFLRNNDVQTRIVFLPDPLGDDLKEGVQRYPAEVLEELARLVSDSDLIGIGLMTNYLDNAIQITRHLRQTIHVPILWGGVHATIRPEECIEFADLVCVGEGEEAVLDIVRQLEGNKSLSKIPNIWSKKNTTVIRNAPRPLTRNLDDFPIPDYSCLNHFVYHDRNLLPLTPARMEMFFSRGTVSKHLGKIGYQTMTGRGCPHKCSYCINDAVKKLYGPVGYLRWRSPLHVINELREAKRMFPFLDFIWISDDAFFSRSLSSLRQFCELYRQEIGLPFSCLASPLTVTKEKMEILVDAGLIYLQMGVQTGSSRIQELFNRQSMNNEVMLSAMNIIHDYRDRMDPPSYDFILDVPYETLEDKMESLRFIARIPKPFRLQPFSLVLYPGTRLHDLATADGLIRNENRDIYAKSYTMQKPTYTNLLILMAKRGKFPSRWLYFLSMPSLVRLMEKGWMKGIVACWFVGLKRLAKLIRQSSPET